MAPKEHRLFDDYYSRKLSRGAPRTPAGAPSETGKSSCPEKQRTAAPAGVVLLRSHPSPSFAGEYRFCTGASQPCPSDALLSSASVTEYLNNKCFAGTIYVSQTVEDFPTRWALAHRIYWNSPSEMLCQMRSFFYRNHVMNSMHLLAVIRPTVGNISIVCSESEPSASACCTLTI